MIIVSFIEYDPQSKQGLDEEKITHCSIITSPSPKKDKQKNEYSI